jgi:hypothetical protein
MAAYKHEQQVKRLGIGGYVADRRPEATVETAAAVQGLVRSVHAPESAKGHGPGAQTRSQLSQKVGRGYRLD